MNRSGKYELMRREYITGDESVTMASLAEKYGRSPGSVGRMAAKEGWLDDRNAFRRSVSEKVTDQAADEYSGRVLKLQGDFLEALETSITKYHAGVQSGQIVPNPSDIAKLMQTAREIVSKQAPQGSEDAGGGIRISEGIARELFGSLETIARDRLATGAVERAPRPKLVGSGQG